MISNMNSLISLTGIADTIQNQAFNIDLADRVALI